MDTAAKYKAAPTGNNKYKSILKQKLDEETFKEVIQLIEKESQQRMKCLINHVDQTVHPSPTTFSAPPTVASKPESNSSIVACDSIRAQVNKATCTADKISLLIGATKDIQGQIREGKKLVEPLKAWAYRAGRVSECVRQCHGGSVESFLLATPKFTQKKFVCSKGLTHKPCFDRSKIQKDT